MPADVHGHQSTASLPPQEHFCPLEKCKMGAILTCVSHIRLTAVGFEPTQLALVELESTPLDHSGKLSVSMCLLLQVSTSTGRSACQ